MEVHLYLCRTKISGTADGGDLSILACIISMSVLDNEFL